MHSYLNWTKQRLDEMDATLASLEARASEVKADSKAKAEQLIADLNGVRVPKHCKGTGTSRRGRLGCSKSAIGFAMEQLRSAGQNLLRNCGQADRTTTIGISQHRLRTGEGLA